MHSFIAVIIGLVFALAATVLLYIFVMPKSKEGCLPAFFQTLRDFFNFKTLYLEFIIKVVYTFSTLACIFMGFFLLFAHDYYSSTALQGLLIMILGPIVLRITYELLIMTVLLVKNVMEINGKLRGTARKEVRQPVMRYCTMCGTRYDITAGRCPVCGGKGKPRHKRPTPPDVIYSPPPAETPETAYEPAPDTAPDPEPAPDVTPEASPDASDYADTPDESEEYSAD